MIKHLNYIVKDKIDEILSNDEVEIRGLKCKELLFQEINTYPDNVVIDLVERPFNWKYFAAELYWYLKQDLNADFISNYSKFWSKLTNDIEDNEFAGKINSNYGYLTFKNNKHNVSNIDWVVNSLIDDEYSRKAIMNYNGNNHKFYSNKDFVCTKNISFYIRDKKLNMVVDMRSNDLYYGLTYDVPWFGFLHQNIFSILKDFYPDLQIGVYKHKADNLHIYSGFYNVKNEVGKNYTLILREPFFKLSENKVTYTETCENFINDFEVLHNSDLNVKSIKKEHYKKLIKKYFII